MSVKATRLDALQLFHAGALALAQVEANGMKVDEQYLQGAIHKISKEIRDLEEELKGMKLYRTWKKAFGFKTKIGSKEQLGHVLFNVMGLPCENRTPTKRPKVDQSALEMIDLPFVKSYLRMGKLKQTRDVFLKGIEREVVDGYIHPFFNLASGEDDKGGARSFRSSSDSPNVQNLPTRDPERGDIVRRCFVPRGPKRRLVDIDYSQLEVRISACINKDPVLIQYIEDKTKDMHRDMAAQLYLLKPEQVSKKTRYAAKNQFVFPQFYGSYYPNCAKGLWECLDRLSLAVGEKGQPLKQHLKNQGIGSLGLCNPKQSPRPGTFENHVKKVEEDFWGRRFRVYAQWKRDWWAKYQRRGYFDMPTGFRIIGVYSRNDVSNYVVQGPAFHCLLRSLIMLQKWLVENKMKSKIICQIHDSIILDVAEDELKAVVEAATRIMTKEIRKVWEWIIVPLEVEVEMSPVGGSRAEKEKA